MSGRKAKPIPVAHVLEGVSRQTGVTLARLVNPHDQAAAVRQARQLAIFVMDFRSEIGFPEIGARLGGLKVKAVRENLERARELIDNSESFGRHATASVRRAEGLRHGHKAQAAAKDPGASQRRADREKLGPLPDGAKYRNCLNCQKKMISTWAGERLCAACKRSRAFQSGPDLVVAEVGAVGRGGRS